MGARHGKALLGFQMGFWDYATFIVLAILVAAGLGVAVSFWAFRAASRFRAITRKPRRST